MDNAQSNRKSALHNPKLNGACPELVEGVKSQSSMELALSLSKGSKAKAQWNLP